MSQFKRRASDFAEDNSFHPRRIRMLLLRNWKLIISFPILAMLISFGTYLTSIPRYVSFSRVQLQQYSLSKLMNDQVVSPNDIIDETTRMQNVVSIFEKDIFMDSLVDEVLNGPEKDSINLVLDPYVLLNPKMWFSKLGITKFEMSKKDLSKLPRDELVASLSALITTTPQIVERSIDIKVSAYDPKSAQSLNRAVVQAFLKASREIDRRELSSILELFAEQAKNTQDHLQELEAKLAEFLRTNPYFSNETATNNFFAEYSRLKMRKVILEKQTESNKALLTFLKNKWQSRNPDALATYQSLEKANRELVELKYSLLRLKQLQYKDEDAAVVELQTQIELTEKFVDETKARLSPNDITNAETENYQKEPLAKLTQLQETLLKDQYELKSVDQSLAVLENDVKDMSQKGAVRNYLKREIDSFSTVHADAFKRWHMGTLRNIGEKGAFSIAQEPTLPTRSINLPFKKSFIFSIFIGLAFALSLILIMESLNPKIIERTDLEGSDLFYAGRLNSTNASRAEILSSISALSVEEGKQLPTQIVLCASPSAVVDIRYFEPLARYLADRGHKSLMVAVGHSVIPEGYEKVNTSRFVHFFQYPGGNEHLIWVLEDDAFDAVKTIVNKYKSNYHTIFICVREAEESAVYALCQKMADRLLLLGAIGGHTKKDYMRLSRGFEKVDSSHVALIWDYKLENIKPQDKGMSHKVIQKLFKKDFFEKAS